MAYDGGVGYVFKILRQMSGMECPACGGKMCVGAVKWADQRAAVYCAICDFRAAVFIIEVAPFDPNEDRSKNPPNIYSLVPTEEVKV